MLYVRLRSSVEKHGTHRLCEQGQWIPFFSAAIFDANARLERDGYTPLNLVSAMIGKTDSRVNSRYALKEMNRERTHRLLPLGDFHL